MSFAKTIPQMRSREKTVTRRSVGTWKTLAPGDRLMAVEKAMGLAKGEKQVQLAVIEVVANEVVDMRESLTKDDVRREGFGGWLPSRFLAEVWEPMNGPVPLVCPVRRIEFKFMENEENQNEV